MTNVRVVVDTKDEGMKLHLHMLAMPMVEIPDKDYRNETVIAEALRKLADTIEKGCSFQVVKVLEGVPFASEWR